MILRRLYHERLAQASYLIGCETTRRAIVVDPLRDPARYLEAASFDDLRIELVAETHVHADFLSGAEALAGVSGAELLLSSEGGDEETTARVRRTGARGLRDGDSLSLGCVRLDVRHTPGHTPEHLVFVVTDEATSELAVGFLSGDFLFAGDVGRPDLLERAVGIEGSMRRSAAELFRSLQTLRGLPEYLQVWPGHGAGSACGKSLGAVPQTTLGYELRTNWAFQIVDEQEFVRTVLADQPEPPAYFARMKQMNAHGVPAMPDPPRAADLRDRVREGALVVDLRPSAEFLEQHLEGSISLPLGRSFLTYAGSVLDPERDLVLLLPADALHEADSVALDLALIGYDRTLGALPAVGLESFAPRRTASIQSTEASELSARAAGVTVVDVRSAAEWNEGHVPGAVHVPLAHLTSQLPDLRSRQPIVTYCRSGSRSVTAASVLRAAGIADVSNAEGGFEAWLRDEPADVAGQRR
ncbi:MAG TPA: MBL fold metallo-hydrolase [Gemmatimonadaceae bacterium]|nr:MBL fold metallo-hydrolase [Gemmatimonadaceae bacterium]